jgi:hypothetical protein
LVAAKGALFIIVRYDILSKLGSNRFKKVAKMPDDGKITQNCVAALTEVINYDPAENDQ